MSNNYLSNEILQARREFMKTAEEALAAIREFDKQWEQAIERAEHSVLKAA